MVTRKSFYFLLGSGMLLACGVEAHPLHDAQASFSGGLLHPLFGWDHLLAMIAMGIGAHRLAASARWRIGVAVILALGLGMFGGVMGLRLGAIEPLLALSLLALGILVARQVDLPSVMRVALFGGFALLHGYAHGSEMQPSALFGFYAFGVLCASSGLFLLGLGGAQWARRVNSRWTSRGGLALAGAGLWLLISG